MIIEVVKWSRISVFFSFQHELALRSPILIHMKYILMDEPESVGHNTPASAVKIYRFSKNVFFLLFPQEQHLFSTYALT